MLEKCKARDKCLKSNAKRMQIEIDILNDKFIEIEFLKESLKELVDLV